MWEDWPNYHVGDTVVATRDAPGIYKDFTYDVKRIYGDEKEVLVDVFVPVLDTMVIRCKADIFVKYKEEKKMSIKVGDTVKAIGSGCGYTKGRLYTVARFVQPYSYRFIDVIDKETGKIGYGCYTSNFKKVDLPKHEGKILIMVDEKDNNKIIARDLITNKTAEAKCNPKDEWDFNKGAKLALERLTEPEKPKGWTGKVVCVAINNNCFGRGNTLFTVGKVYTVQDGDIYDGKTVYTGIRPIRDVNDLINGRNNYCPAYCKFIEYKGGAEE